MRKVYKTPDCGFGSTEPVKIDNTVFIPNGDGVLSDTDLETMKRREKESEEKIFREAVNAEVKRITDASRAATEAEKKRIIDEAKSAAHDIAADAKKKTDDIIAKTKSDCETLRERAKQEGHKEGYDDGKKEALNKCGRYIDAAADLLAEINAHKEAYYIENEQELKDTLYFMVEKVTGAELKANPEVIEKIIYNAAKSFRNSDYLKISLAEGEVARELKSDTQLINKIIPYIKDIDIEILPDAEDGTIILDDDEKIVDASVPTQLDFLREILRNTRGEDDTDA